MPSRDCMIDRKSSRDSWRSFVLSLMPDTASARLSLPATGDVLLAARWCLAAQSP